ncbi:MAG: hypothetical protein JWO24_2943 [Rhodospirillales bacterium]|nr:hypothetical protein [Rhodospirillales bacterium]
MAQKFPTMFTRAAPVVHCYIERPDDKTPDGATWKVDNKYKAKLVFGDEADCADVREACLKLLKETFGSVLPAEDELLLPLKSGDGDKNEEFHGKTLLSAASQFQPKVYDAKDNEVPAGVFPRGGDVVRFRVSLYPFSKAENVKDSKTKKTTAVTVYGVSLRLAAVQIITKGAASSGFGVQEGGYEATAADAKVRDEASDETPAERTTTRRTGADADF